MTAQEKPTSPRTRAGQSLLRGKRVHARVICDIELEAYAEGHRHATQAFANAGEAAGKDSPATPSLDVERLASLVTRSYMRGWGNGRYNNAPPNPMAAVEELNPALARLDEGSATPEQGKGEPR